MTFKEKVHKRVRNELAFLTAPMSTKVWVYLLLLTWGTSMAIGS